MTNDHGEFYFGVMILSNSNKVNRFQNQSRYDLK